MSAKLRAPFPYYGSKQGPALLIERLMGPISNLVITLCGKGDEHDELLAAGWTRHQWRDDGEVIWASPHCVVDADFGPLFLEVLA